MKRFKNILYFADGPVRGAHAFDRAVALARTNQARLTVLDVIPEARVEWGLKERYGVRVTESIREQRLDELAVLTAPHTDAGTAVSTDVIIGTPFIEVIRAVDRNGYDLLVKTARPPAGLTANIFGSADTHLLRKCPCPVWIDRPGSAHPYRTLLAAVDPMDPRQDEFNRLVMDLATSLAAREQAALHVVHAWRLYGEATLRDGRGRIPRSELEDLLAATEQDHREALDRLARPYGLTAAGRNVHLIKGEAAAVIAKEASDKGADLIVMGTVGRTGVPGLFIGNTAEDVLKATRTAVLAVKPPGFISPVKLT